MPPVHYLALIEQRGLQRNLRFQCEPEPQNQDITSHHITAQGVRRPRDRTAQRGSGAENRNLMTSREESGLKQDDPVRSDCRPVTLASRKDTAGKCQRCSGYTNTYTNIHTHTNTHPLKLEYILYVQKKTIAQLRY